MGFFQIIMLVFKYGPAAFKIISEIMSLVAKLRSTGNEAEAQAAEGDMEEAVKEYKRTKSKERLRRLQERLAKRCKGPNCPVPPDAAA